MTKNTYPKASRLSEIMQAVLADKKEGDGVLVVHGVRYGYAIDPTKIEAYRDELRGMISHLDPAFLVEGGGGAPFLYLNQDNGGTIWTGLHTAMEELFVLGQALKIAKVVQPGFAGTMEGFPFIAFTLQEGVALEA